VGRNNWLSAISSFWEFIAMSSNKGSVSQWIEGLRAGDDEAAARLWQRYFQRLVRLAAQRLGGAPRRVADEEDMAVSAFQSLCRRVQQDQFPDLRDRHDLWNLIVRITERKAYDQLRAQNRKKRGSGLVAGESAWLDPGESGGAAGINGVVGREPTPEFAAEMVEAVDELLERLDDDELRRIALMKLEGYSNDEIATAIGRSRPTVERRLRVIREIWGTEPTDE
jgi:RNA polymerase sigma factor (sigma-70 family)